MPVHDDLGCRMKDYEKRNRYYLHKRMPAIFRLDMRAGHSFCKGLKRPFDEIFVKTMQETAKYLCENIQNVKISYQQSDEISLVLVDYERLNTEVFFDYRIDKVCSVVASMATMAFNKAFAKNVKEYDMEWKCSLTPQCVEMQKAHYDYIDILNKAVEKGAMFDCRCFNIPKEEVTNAIYWRQLDATRNSIQMVGQANFSHTELHEKNQNDIQDMLMLQKGINWNDFPTHLKRGSCCIKETYYPDAAPGYEDCDIDATTARTRWIVDKEITIFKGEGRAYIDKLVFVGE